MCNHYRNDPTMLAKLPTWREYISWFENDPLPDDVAATATDVWPKRTGLVVHSEAGKPVASGMQWGVPMTVPGKRPGTTITKAVTNVRNLSSPFWRSMLGQWRDLAASAIPEFIVGSCDKGHGCS